MAVLSFFFSQEIVFVLKECFGMFSVQTESQYYGGLWTTQVVQNERELL